MHAAHTPHATRSTASGWVYDGVASGVVSAMAVGRGCGSWLSFEPTIPSPNGIGYNVSLKLKTSSVDKMHFLTRHRLETADEKTCVLKELIAYLSSAGGCSTLASSSFRTLCLFGLAYQRRMRE